MARKIIRRSTVWNGLTVLRATLLLPRALSASEFSPAQQNPVATLLVL
jgi:hypothetical protein